MSIRNQFAEPIALKLALAAVAVSRTIDQNYSWPVLRLLTTNDLVTAMQSRAYSLKIAAYCLKSESTAIQGEAKRLGVDNYAGPNGEKAELAEAA